VKQSRFIKKYWK